MLRPIQLWLPGFQCVIESPPSRWDATMRAHLAWWQHDHVWWLPSLREERTWHDDKGHHIAVPAAYFEHVTVIHIGTNGYAYGRGAEVVFPERKLGTILEDWLEAPSRELLRWVTPPKSVSGTAPQFGEDGTLSYAEIAIPVEIGTTTPGAAPNFVCWEGPLHPLFPPFTDDLPLRHLASMRTIAKEASADATTALRKATVLATPYLQEGHSTSELAWFCPQVVERGKSVGLSWIVGEAASHRFGLDKAFSRSFTQYLLRDMAAIDEVLASTAWQQFLRRQIPVRRAWGPLGLFWALLVDSLESQTLGTGVCTRCGRMLTGKRGKQFCGPDDDPQCYRDRRADDQRRSRDRRRPGA
jgi:hypothetical protein